MLFFTYFIQTPGPRIISLTTCWTIGWLGPVPCPSSKIYFFYVIGNSTDRVNWQLFHSIPWYMVPRNMLSISCLVLTREDCCRVGFCHNQQQMILNELVKNTDQQVCSAYVFPQDKNTQKLVSHLFQHWHQHYLPFEIQWNPWLLPSSSQSCNRIIL